MFKKQSLPVIKITNAGWLYIALTLFLGFAGVNTSNNLIYLIVSALLGFMAISGFFGKRNLSRIDIDAEIPQEIFANKEFPLKISLKNLKGFFPIFLMRVKIRGQSLSEKGTVPLFRETLFPFVDKKSYSSGYMDISFKKRGRHVIKEIYICSVFPFNFFVRCRRLGASFDFIVFPEPKKSALLNILERQRLSKGEIQIDKTGYESEMLSIREYILGDPFKYINWKATAKTGGLKTKELSSLAYQPIVIDFEKIDIKNIEEKISCITYMILQLLRKNIPVGIKIGGRFYKPDISNAHKISILNELALYGIEKYDSE
ncbi:MAG: DUF58 domain-containing protein [Nitrospirae bacterium]|nr:DUF58 domain-containing protein [Nitrospirota bacterium]